MAATIKLAPGATEADIKKALASLTDGGTLVLPKDQTISISTGISIDVSKRDITLDLNGSRLVKAGNCSVITASGGHDPAASVKLGLDAAHNTTITYSKLPTGLAVGSWVKVISDDVFPNDMYDANIARMGQALQVASIKGNTVTFQGELLDQGVYKTNVRATTYASGDFVVKNGTVVGDQKHPSWNSPLVQLRSLVDGRVEDLHVRDGVGRGINIVDGVNNHIEDVTVRNLADGGSAALGIGVSSLSSTGTKVNGYYAEKVTHAADDNAIGVKPNSAYVVQYGPDIGMHVENAVAYGTRNFAYSWHSEVVNGSFENVMAFDSHGFMTGRGVGGSMTNSGGVNNERGIMLYEYGRDDSRYINVDNVTLKETGNYSVISSNQPLFNSIKNSYLESFINTNLAAPGTVTVTNTKFVKVAPTAVNDTITGTGKTDLLLGGRGTDTISGGLGNDYVWGGAGVDKLTGGAGRDRFAFHSMGEVGDTITDFQAGTTGDVIDFSVLMAKYSWKAGDPIANGYVRFVQSGSDTNVMVDAAKTGSFVMVAKLTGVKAALLGSANLRTSLSDETAGGAVQAASGRPQMVGDEYNDYLQGDAATWHIAGMGGDDSLMAAATTSAPVQMEGGAGNDKLTGASGADTLDGGAGNDVMAGRAGNDAYRVDTAGDKVVEAANEGWDVVVTGAQLSGPLTANVEQVSLTGGANLAAAGNELNNVLWGNSGNNAFWGAGGNDKLYGETGNDKLYAGAGNDSIYGGSGADWLEGGAGQDVLEGGADSDVFYIASLDHAGDTINDFHPGADKIALSGDAFGVHSMADIAFISGSGAVPATGKSALIYNTESGQLFWDADGSGAQKALLLATLTDAPNLTQQDIQIT